MPPTGRRARVSLKSQVSGLDKSSVWTNSVWVNITDAPHLIELDWQRGTTASLAGWIDEAAQPAPSAINNNDRRIDRVRLGAVAAVDSTTNGTLYFDAFRAAPRAQRGVSRVASPTSAR